MLYLKYTYVDAVTKKSIIDEPAANGPASPEVTGLAFGFALESQYPTNSPVFYGTASDDADLTIAGVIGSVSKVEYDAAQVAEMATRTSQIQARTEAMLEQAVQAKLNGSAIASGYDSIATAVSYAEEPAVPKFQNDGIAFRAWRSLVWAYIYEQLALVTTGKREQPTVDAFLLELPALKLPA
ncbi:hypothetical protein [Pseudomonas sp. CCI2.4]|uniref:hypothetical protein n=1 Tax=Pseudomonas sp. CCI2.4 TaxID=3048617 RepID=UPI002B2393E5|nr:hypothetical protein [Pseudomonas sp. CCI2.4]MEB0132663.1 hypothetical protein [Pseudomonas sp. CCI2.4]